MAKDTDIALKQIVDELMQLGDKKFFKTILLLNAITAKTKVINQENADLKKYAELGLLAMEAIEVFHCKNCDGIFDCVCPPIECEWYQFCRKRAELLAEVQK